MEEPVIDEANDFLVLLDAPALDPHRLSKSEVDPLGGVDLTQVFEDLPISPGIRFQGKRNDGNPGTPRHLDAYRIEILGME